MSELIAILGAGQASAWACRGLLDAGFKGRIVLIGAEPHLPYERPPLSKESLTGLTAKLPVVFAEEFYRNASIDLRLSEVGEAIDVAESRLHLRSGETMPFDKLLICTGSRPRLLAGVDEGRIYYLRTFDDALRLKERLRTARKVVCVGAGVVGMEVAASARKLGCDVTVVERDEQPMRRCLDAAQANFLRQQHESAGVRFHFGVNVRGISGAASSASSIHLDATELPADCVVAGIGMVRNSEIASASGIHVDDGILVDECGRTSVSNIFAAGDVAAFYSPAYCRVVRLESWQHAMDHGSAVGRCMAGDSAPYDEIPWFWTQQHDVNIHVTGFAAGAARTTVRTVTARSFIAFHTNADGHLVGVTSTGPRRDARAAAALIRLRARLDVEEMASPAKSLAMLVAERTSPAKAP